MKKVIKIILLVLGIFLVALMVLYFLVIRGVVPINIVPGARTLYTGYVEIEPVSLAEIKTKLEERGCYANNYKSGNDGSVNFCLYTEEENGVEVYPRGAGFGYLSFSLTQNKLLATKDIFGPPDPDKFKEEVRQNVHDIGDVIKIRENSWKITETKYPWTVVY